ncbi:hypothetical protein BU15DRAFT_59772 [Melanogaster broomeanus]|nr:hypothetical protein BU15DRAFT_59772 [Melanogaster broomeanus]
MHLSTRSPKPVNPVLQKAIRNGMCFKETTAIRNFDPRQLFCAGINDWKRPTACYYVGSNAFVFAQILNSVNSRRLDRKLNVFEDLLRNYYFIVITLIETVVQVLIVFVGGAASQVTTICAREWDVSLALGVVSLPLGALICLLPNEPFEKLFAAIQLSRGQMRFQPSSPMQSGVWLELHNPMAASPTQHATIPPSLLWHFGKASFKYISNILRGSLVTLYGVKSERQGLLCSSRSPWLVAGYGNHLRRGKTDKSWNDSEGRKNTYRENTVVGEETAQR